MAYLSKLKTDFKLHLLNMSLASRFLRSKKRDLYVKKICSYVIMSKKNIALMSKYKTRRSRVSLATRYSLLKI